MSNGVEWVTEQMENATQQGPGVSHVVHHYEAAPRKVTIKLDRNSRGYTWEVSYAGETLAETLALVREANERLEAEYGG